MLYVSTRNKADSFTAYRVLHGDKPSDGGFFVPFHLPVFTAEEIAGLKDKSFSETVANILNLFFSRHLTSWDVEFSVGRYPFRMETIGQRVTIAELWHNTNADYNYLVANLYKKLSDQPVNNVPQWVHIAIEIAVLFGLYGELLRCDVEAIDLAVADTSFRYPAAAWYARKMGLPISMILCACSEESGLWDFLRRGEAAINVPEEIEYLVYENFGKDAINDFVDTRNNGRTYRLSELNALALSRGIYPSVIGQDRITSIVASIQRNCGYGTDSLTAAAYGALQDYRSATGENRATLILSRCCPKE